MGDNRDAALAAMNGRIYVPERVAEPDPLEKARAEHTAGALQQLRAPRPTPRTTTVGSVTYTEREPGGFTQAEDPRRMAMRTPAKE